MRQSGKEFTIWFKTTRTKRKNETMMTLGWCWWLSASSKHKRMRCVSFMSPCALCQSLLPKGHVTTTQQRRQQLVQTTTMMMITRCIRLLWQRAHLNLNKKKKIISCGLCYIFDLIQLFWCAATEPHFTYAMRRGHRHNIKISICSKQQRHCCRYIANKVHATRQTMPSINLLFI